jgi:hypothetical protein
VTNFSQVTPKLYNYNIKLTETPPVKDSLLSESVAVIINLTNWWSTSNKPDHHIETEGVKGQVQGNQKNFSHISSYVNKSSSWGQWINMPVGWWRSEWSSYNSQITVSAEIAIPLHVDITPNGEVANQLQNSEWLGPTNGIIFSSISSIFW